MAVEDILNYIRVSDRIASSGQPEASQFKAIAETGYRAVINLAMPDSPNAIPEEGHIVSAHDMVYLHMPVPFEAPNIEHLTKFIRLMEALSNEKIWVHCVLNKRVSAFLYQYQRLVHGESLEEAAKVMLTSWKPDPVWQWFMALDLGRGSK